MIICGVDPGLNATGYGFVRSQGNRIAPLLWGVIRSQAAPLPERLARIYWELLAVLKENTPDVVAIEEVFLGRNPRAAITMGQARGVVLLAAAHGGFPVREYATATVKQSVVGGGRASKKQVDYMVRKLLGLGDSPLPADAADALAVALCCLIRGDFQPEMPPGGGL